MTTQALVVELLTEELPPKALKRLGEEFAQTLVARLAAEGFVADATRYENFATPRRLGVSIPAVAERSPDQPFKQKVLPVSVAFAADGKPTPALEKKLASLGLDSAAVASMTRERDGKADALFHTGVRPGKPLAEGLQSALDDAIAKLPIPKVMSYAASGYFNDQKFVRPAHGLLALHGGDIVGVRALGLTAGRKTSGHRFLARQDIGTRSADAYAPTLEAEGKVIPSFASRRRAIETALARAAGDAKIVAPDALLDEVTALVEWPVVYEGRFDPAFLDVPQECLILTMQQNQKYFPLADAKGALLPRFLVASNLATTDPSAIVHGNERVLRARLADAKFFFDQDRRQPLAARVDRLRAVVYHAKLGTLAERVDRLRFLSQRIAPQIGADAALADRAALLAKADLVTDMVGEFPELQGTMGRYYARHDGEPAAVADAIAQHYQPRFAGDAIPDEPVAQAVALADKLEALAGLFGIGQVPTGDKDPYGLRRAALGVVRILVEKAHRVSLAALVDSAFEAFGGVAGVAPDSRALLDFIYERLRGYLRDQGYTANQVAAVIDARPDTIDDLPARLAAVKAFEALPEAAALAAANKRIGNILKKTDEGAAARIDDARLAQGAERDLYDAFEALGPGVAADCARGDYTSALRSLAAVKPAVDRFFDDVLVMADDPAVRANRLALLRSVAVTMNRVADISKLAT
jgi:glycyl-tRNA synthetase beta chain